MKRTKKQIIEGRRDVTIKKVDPAVWRKARLVAMLKGVTMADYIEDLLKGAKC